MRKNSQENTNNDVTWGLKYADDVEAGKIVTNRYIKLAVKRFRKDCKKYDLDLDEAQRVLNFTSMLRFGKGDKAGQHIVWTPWQIFFMINIFGFYHKVSGKRRFRYFYVEVARKNGKSTLMAAVVIVFLMLFDEAIPEIFCAASVKAQAEPVFKEAKRMLQDLRNDFKKDLKPRIALFSENITFQGILSDGRDNEGVVKMVASNAPTLDGTHPFFTSLDEIHSHKDSSVFNVFKSGTGGRTANTPLIGMITTAGFSLVSFAFMIRKNFCQILEGTKADDDTFIMIFTIDKDDDYNDPEVWVKANPSLGESINMDWLKSEYRQAQNFPSELVNFLTKNLNIWMGSQDNWISREILDRNDGKPLTDDEMEEGRVYLGVDLGMVNDLTALCVLTIFGDDRLHLKFKYYMSRKAYQKFIAQGIPMDQWMEEGCDITINPGEVTDHRTLQDDIVDVVETLNVEKIGFDRWESHQIVTELDHNGIEVEAIGQGYRTQNESIKYVEKAMAEDRFVLEGDQMIKWMFANVVLDMDPAGNRKLNKKKSDNKIDGVSALLNALYCFIQVDGGRERPTYGIRTIGLR